MARGSTRRGRTFEEMYTIATHAITDLTTLENISKRGWFFSSPAGNSIDAKFLFGQSKVIPQDELRVEIGPWDGKSELSFYSVEDIPQNEKEDYQSIEDFGKKESGGKVEIFQLNLRGFTVSKNPLSMFIMMYKSVDFLPSSL